MFVAMNRFKVRLGGEDEFETIWKTRDSYLNEVEGFVEFHLLRGPVRDDHTLFASHSIWRTREDFENWTRSEAFRKAHSGAQSTRDIYLGHPEFEGFEAVQELKAE